MSQKKVSDQAGTASEILSLDLRDSWLGKSEQTTLVGGLLCTAKPGLRISEAVPAWEAEAEVDKLGTVMAAGLESPPASRYRS